VAPRVYPQYFNFDQVDRKNHRGRAQESPTPADSSPRMLDNRGPFSFGGPAFPIARTLELEQTLVTEFVTLVRSMPEKLDLPIDSPLEAQP
jgi:hypothetical protein